MTRKLTDFEVNNMARDAYEADMNRVLRDADKTRPATIEEAAAKHSYRNQPKNHQCPDKLSRVEAELARREAAEAARDEDKGPSR